MNTPLPTRSPSKTILNTSYPRRVHCIFGKGGVREWGADPDKYYYILQILHIESIENWKGGNV